MRRQAVRFGQLGGQGQRRRPVAVRARAGVPWLFPGRSWTHPISPDTLRGRLADIGLPTHVTRTAALFQLAVELPAGMLARCLGIDISCAVTWQRAAAGDWHAYAACATGYTASP